MGLDMYLHKKEYVKIWDFMPEEQKVHIFKQVGNGPMEEIFPSFVVTEVGYWRKANQIHKFFVDNLNNGLDDCNEYYCPRETLEELQDKVNYILTNVKTSKHVKKLEDREFEVEVILNPEICKETLPTQLGFFFGSYDYDEYYLEDIRLTKEILDRALSDEDRVDFHYRASW